MKSPLPGQVPPLNRLDNQSLHSELEQNLALDPRQTKHTPGMCVCVGGGAGGLCQKRLWLSGRHFP